MKLLQNSYDGKSIDHAKVEFNVNYFCSQSLSPGTNLTSVSTRDRCVTEECRCSRLEVDWQSMGHGHVFVHVGLVRK